MVGRLKAYMAVVSAIGFVVLFVLAANVDLDQVRDSLPAGALLALVVLVAPFLAIPISRDGRGPSIHVDTPFVFALALAAGTGAAAVAMAASGLLYDLAHRKPLHKVAFNNGTHTIGLAAGAAVWMALAGGQVTGSSALPAILTGTAVFVAVKMTLFGAYLALEETVGPTVGLSRFLRPSGAGGRHGPGRRAGAGAGGRASRRGAARPGADARRLPAAARRDQGGAGPPGRRADGQAGSQAAGPGAGGGPQAQGDRPDEGRPAGHGLPRAADPAHHGRRGAAAALRRAGPQRRGAPGDAGDGRPPGEDHPVWLLGERDGRDAVLAVEDDGPGVPPEERERVFERFTRLEPGRGLGLGLYIARQLARAQGGDLVVTGARVATGARFELRLPLRAPAEQLLPSSAEDRTAPLRVVPGPARRSG
jgi:Histidine kinase-, DNA gyrase B-, and HSP90-like ATPase